MLKIVRLVVAGGLVAVLFPATTIAKTQVSDEPQPVVLEVVNLPEETISEAEIIELATAALGENQKPITIVFKEVLDEDAPYTIGIWRRASRTVELRSTLTSDGIRFTLIHEIAHALTEGVGDSHGVEWCKTHVDLMRTHAADLADREARKVHKQYGCPGH